MGRWKYTPEQRLEIGGMIYRGELNRYQAAVKYGISIDTARNYMRLYRAQLDLAAMADQPPADASAPEGADA